MAFRFDIPDDAFNPEQTEIVRSIIGAVSGWVRKLQDGMTADNIPLTIPGARLGLDQSMLIPLQEVLEPIRTNGEYQNTVPEKGVIMFDGTISEARLLKQWGVCDGVGGPDLRHKFIRGAGADQGAGDTGGADTAEVNVSVSDHDSHDHTVGGSGTTDDNANSCCVCACNPDHAVPTHPHNHTFDFSGTASSETISAHEVSSDDVSIVPTYYELIFLKKKAS